MNALAELSQLRELVVTLKEALELSRHENTLLRQKIDLLVKRVFGSSSEQLDKNQLELLAQDANGSTAATVASIVAAPEKERAERSRKERTARLPENLPVVEEVLDPEPVKAQPEQWRCIGQEISEQLDYEPGRFLRRRVVRRKYVHKTNPDRAPVIAASVTPELVAGPEPARARIARPHRGGKILRPSSLIPAGTNLSATSWSSSAPAELDPLGGAGVPMVETHL